MSYKPLAPFNRQRAVPHVTRIFYLGETAVGAVSQLTIIKFRSSTTPRLAGRKTHPPDVPYITTCAWIRSSARVADHATKDCAASKYFDWFQVPNFGALVFSTENWARNSRPFPRMAPADAAAAQSFIFERSSKQGDGGKGCRGRGGDKGPSQ